METETADLLRLSGRLGEGQESPCCSTAAVEQNLLSAILDIVGALVLILDRNGRVVCFNRACEKTSGYDFSEIKGKCLWDFLTREEDIGLVKVNYERIIKGDYPAEYENFWICKNATERLIAWSNTALLNENSEVIYVIATGIDITERKLTEQRLQYLAHFDSLTDLPNRTLFYDRLGHILGHSRRYNQMFALLFLDLDGFKFVNDSLGHDMGDLLIKMAAARLPKCVRASDTVAHVGGDEFVIILPLVEKAREAALVAEKIHEAFSTPFHLDTHECFITLSIGISIYPSDGDDVDTLLKNSDIAMYQAKEKGRNTYQFYNSEMNTRALRRLKLENNLRKALERNEFIIHYQPKIDLNSWSVCGVEALIRWINSQYGLISPAEFIPLAEDTGLIIAIGEWVLRTACAQAKQWLDAGHTGLLMSVNLSARQFTSQNLVLLIENILQETGLPAGFLELELTESVVMDDAESAIKILRDIKTMGVHVAIDDFGMGYSSLSYLKRFPIDRLKIDKSFVRDITTDPDDEAIATAIIAMSHSLKLKVIAEGVETNGQLEFLRSLNCDEAQGYLFSKPLPVKDIEAYLKSKKIKSGS
ncbi:sensor domain-containing protein [Candidatus Magnetobacterium casense]|uniref:EAL domain-containing protein n=1 Tax=Candidatus Magnetobacterium casense TaxID=1455061 RepID=A0ABS6RZC8_9BACT|nr:EAL domain-containing protein [Candidatus Magnetobacterium casensis]MBV6341998.1 EAL domain-containing protein [Candidatus Magnetobacterium casensis]